MCPRRPPDDDARSEQPEVDSPKGVSTVVFGGCHLETAMVALLESRPGLAARLTPGGSDKRVFKENDKEERHHESHPRSRVWVARLVKKPVLFSLIN